MIPLSGIQLLASVLRPEMHRAMMERQIVANKQTRAAWNSFASQRHIVTRLILDGLDRAACRSSDAKSPLQVAILGAGNANDFDLQSLTSATASHTNSSATARPPAEFHLFDWDAEALASIGERQPEANWSAIHCHAPIDLSGLQTLQDFHQSPTSTDHAALPSLSHSTGNAIQAASGIAGFDLVVSSCVLSQILDSLQRELRPWRDEYHSIVPELRNEHLRLLTHCTRPGGTLLFITDFVSSDTAPDLHTIGHQELPRLVRQFIEQRNFFTGLNPAVISHILRTDVEVSQRVAQLEITEPWIWNPGPRLYAVCGFVASLV